MTKEQAKKHGEVIKWYCDNADQGVLYKDCSEWFLTYEPSWTEDFIFVQNDEYAELRKAQADGKIIQHKHCNDSDSKFKDCCYPIWEYEDDFRFDYHLYDKEGFCIICGNYNKNYKSSGL